jgi:hypothetical protein
MLAPSSRAARAVAARGNGGAPNGRLLAVAVRAQQQKVNKRGKVASRPGPQGSRKEEAKQIREQRQERRLLGDEPAEQQQQQQQQQQQATPSAASAPVDPSLPSSSASAAASGPASTPQVVVDRMFRRMIVSAGAPVVLALATLPFFYYARVVAKIEYPPWLVYLVAGGLFGGGLLGITYGILSTSWEPRREGSALGFDEFRTNLALILSRRNGGAK